MNIDTLKTTAGRIPLGWLAPYLPGLVSIAMVLVLAYSAAQWTWRLVPAPAETLSATQAAAPVVARTPAVGPRELVRMNLFGNAAPAPVKATQPADEVRPTRLNLVLNGVAATEGGGIAIIQKPGARAEYFTIDSDVFGMARLVEVNANHVVLLRNGQREILSLPDPTARIAGSAVRAGAMRSSDASTQARLLADYRRALLQGNAKKFANNVGYETNYNNGKFAGFKVRAESTRGSAMLKSFGLQDNDVIVEIDGVKLDGSMASVKALKRLRTAKNVAVGVERNGTIEQMTFRFGP